MSNQAVKSDAVSSLKNRDSTGVSLRQQVVVYCLTLICGLGGTWVLVMIVFGSVTDAIARLNGQVVVLEPQTSEFEVEAGKVVEFHVIARSLIDPPVEIVGAEPVCKCVSVGDFPLPLDRSGVRLAVWFSADGLEAGQTVELDVPLYLNVDSSQVVVSIRVKVVEPDSET